MFCITGVLEEAKFFGILSILEQLEEMAKVLVFDFHPCQLCFVSLPG